ncbi:hypothetical protein [Anaerobacillus sp. 1_MG-2023]|uniref:hypothetical protein n=1 Tax=Anaerobacillus sp. 1_MG-2023 TaxID=3062655 RepID=UPI0026E32D84|nr:hypothetical protein [Anaerobacillus sp. 1_MG-2023]MDO6654533.1 hypothetical protein [Anaerobacillus sp. 1_MG-2023]
MKFIRIYAIVSLIMLILLVGCSVNSSTKDYSDETIREAQANVTSYIENNYANIETLTVTDPYEAEMGIMTVDGKVNGEAFSVSLDTDLMVAGIAIQSEQFPEKKEECLERICDD